METAFTEFLICGWYSRSVGAKRTRVALHRRQAVCQAAKTFYEQLDVSKEADARTIKKAFKKMALKYHPDVNKEVTCLILSVSQNLFRSAIHDPT